VPGRHGVSVDIKDSIDAASLPTIRLEVLVDNPDGRRRVRDMEYVGPRRAGGPVTQTGSAMTAEARRRVLPKGTRLIEDRDRMPPPARIAGNALSIGQSAAMPSNGSEWSGMC
jgi:hypothetical protein